MKNKFIDFYPTGFAAPVLQMGGGSQHSGSFMSGKKL
jgi:hypothetical protein